MFDIFAGIIRVDYWTKCQISFWKIEGPTAEGLTIITSPKDIFKMILIKTTPKLMIREWSLPFFLGYYGVNGYTPK